MLERPASDGRTVVIGDDLFEPREWERLASSLGLSAREHDVARAVFDNLTEEQIAGRLAISPYTVHTYLERMYRKLSVRSRVELLVRIFAEHRALARRTTEGGYTEHPEVSVLGRLPHPEEWSNGVDRARARRSDGNRF